ncbi:uncharacterized protein LOC117294008 [Asterias rubens]|uniref:uncharacterized protein LOC117294008 n=1 Tax=Asterias rubens TaxID=7604 RepID=UPI00145500E5|nr:uncharacterized protein LOC117294008 [Asterias rubens]
MSRKQQLDPQTDLLVEWKDGTKHVVKIQDIILVSRKLEKGCKISMKWGQQTWEGRVLDVEGNTDSDDDSDSDIPLAQLKANNQTKAQDTYGSSQMPARCDDFFCSGEVWAACNKCLCFLCYDHFLGMVCSIEL